MRLSIMKNTIKQKSAAKFITVLLAIGVVLYATIVVFVVNNRLSSGIVSYFASEIENQSKTLTKEMNKTLEQAQSTAANIQLAYATIYPEYGFDRTIMNSFALAQENITAQKTLYFLTVLECRFPVQSTVSYQKPPLSVKF